MGSRTYWAVPVTHARPVMVGTTAVVHPAADLPLEALVNGGRLVTLDVETSHLDALASAVLLGPAEDLLPRLMAGLEEPG